MRYQRDKADQAMFEKKLAKGEYPLCTACANATDERKCPFVRDPFDENNLIGRTDYCKNNKGFFVTGCDDFERWTDPPDYIYDEGAMQLVGECMRVLFDEYRSRHITKKTMLSHWVFSVLPPQTAKDAIDRLEASERAAKAVKKSAHLIMSVIKSDAYRSKNDLDTYQNYLDILMNKKEMPDFIQREFDDAKKQLLPKQFKDDLRELLISEINEKIKAVEERHKMDDDLRIELNVMETLQ